MTEEDARQWIADRFGVPRETLLARYAELLRRGSTQQNLVSAATLSQLWQRHLLDSAQLLPLAESHQGPWLDIGSGAGLPGLVVALLTDREVHLIEPRKLRVDFLVACRDELGLGSRVHIHHATVEKVTGPLPDVISARAVAALDRLLASARHLATNDSLWVLPKGRSAESEVAAAHRTWHGQFDLVPSITDPDARIILIRRAAPR